MLNLEYPIFQGAMAWIAEHNLVAAVSNAGGLGIIAAGNAPVEIVREEIRKTKMLTNKPFGVNVPLLYPEMYKIMNIIVKEGVKIMDAALMHFDYGNVGMDGVHAAAPSVAILAHLCQ